MKSHYWSLPIGVYEGISGWKCRDCGISLIGDGYPDPSKTDMNEAGVPRDCSLSLLVAIHEDYKPFTLEDCWNEEDWPPEWENPWSRAWNRFLAKIGFWKLYYWFGNRKDKFTFSAYVLMMSQKVPNSKVLYYELKKKYMAFKKRAQGKLLR